MGCALSPQQACGSGLSSQALGSCRVKGTAEGQGVGIARLTMTWGPFKPQPGQVILKTSQEGPKGQKGATEEKGRDWESSPPTV